MRYQLTINGESIAGAGEFPVINPATEDVVDMAPSCSAAQLDQAMSSAAAAFPAWAPDPVQRSALLAQAAERVRSAAAQLAPLFTAEQGRPLRKAEAEIAHAAKWLDYYSMLELPMPVAYDDDRRRAIVTQRPLGVVAAITPWNAPILLAMWKVAAALAAGNTVVLKPSPATPLTTLALGSLLAEVFPPGVLNVVSGPEPLGRLVAEHPIPRKISVTGSVATGRAVALAAAADLKRVTLELGGNDPAILLDDVALDQIAPEIIASAFANNGQVCEAIKRVYVPRRHYEHAVDTLAAALRLMRVGDGRDPNVDLGPLTTPAQRDRVQELVDDAARSARVVVGGRRLDRPGYFFEPTLVADIADGARLVDEEQFGPALPVIAYDDESQVILRCNASPFGLTASVWSADEQRAAAVANQLEVGRAKINGHGDVPIPEIPFGGVKCSGIGVENGPWGLTEYTTVHVTEYYQSAMPSPYPAALHGSSGKGAVR